MNNQITAEIIEKDNGINGLTGLQRSQRGGNAKRSSTISVGYTLDLHTQGNPTIFAIIVCSHFVPSNQIMKLNRKQISEALNQIPAENILLGTASRELTSKQKKFARLIAEGLTGAEAYRQSYDTSASPKRVGDQAAMLKRDPRISSEISRLTTLNEAREWQSPQQIRALVIERLQMEATNEDNPPNSRIRALELLGKVTEVAAFTERREQTVVHSSEQIRNQIMDRLKSLNVIDIQATEQTDDDAAMLLSEITNEQVIDSIEESHVSTEGAAQILDDADADPTIPAPPAAH